jgi:hypothetical protein
MTDKSCRLHRKDERAISNFISNDGLLPARCCSPPWNGSSDAKTFCQILRHSVDQLQAQEPGDPWGQISPI